MLNQSIEINKINNIKVYNNAVSDKDDKIIRLRLPDYSKSNNFGGLELIKPYQNSDNFNMQLSDNYENIKTIKLDNFKEEVECIKIDVEGIENFVLEGSEKLIVNYRPFLFIELFKSKLDNVIQFFKNKDYNIHSTGRNAYIIPIEAKVNFTGLKKML